MGHENDGRYRPVVVRSGSFYIFRFNVDANKLELLFHQFHLKKTRWQTDTCSTLLLVNLSILSHRDLNASFDCTIVQCVHSLLYHGDTSACQGLVQAAIIMRSV